ncbi:U3 small nucleolar RNA-associated protein 14 homolog A [Salarias fasciatus]|uniref:U3 small nucleolar RNA-associated protein 14 homolog A-like n=1 Tax=Salarias fasciatus TaxID=181472 RepID=A0A672IIQ1_SALFA|nr:U3 small nucleolar RNA-associated protein 14 homolog A-like [Salarias fasciatus]
MAKVSNKKRSGRRKRSAAEQKKQEAPEEEQEVSEEEQELPGADEEVTSEEEEEDGQDERRHQKLLEAISALGGKRKKTLGERSEAATQMSEFTVNSKGEGDRIDLSELIDTAQKTPAVPNKTRKQLKSLKKLKKTIECPLSKQESERIQRDLAFQKAASEVSRWNSIVVQNQRAEQLRFPLDRERSGPKPMERVVTGWKAQTPLEKEIFALLSANMQPIHDPVLTPEEELSLKAMSLEDAKIRRAELQKARALQSYYEAKARRERKIKSKKYHRVQNKAKRKEFLKRFDDMAKTDPAAALEELNKMELVRMQERMSLKHQNSGKWAKSKAVMAKYDEGARKAMQQQLEVNKDLTQKLVTSLNQDEEEEEEQQEEEAELLPECVNDAEKGGEPSNPWMRGKLSEDPAEGPAADPEGAAAPQARAAVEEEEEEEEEEGEEEKLLREFDRRRKQRQSEEAETPAVISLVDDDEDDDDDEGDGEEEKLSEFTNIFRGIVESRQEAASITDDSAQLEGSLQRIRTLQDVELLAEDVSAAEPPPAEPQQPPDGPPAAAPPAEGKSRKRKKGIELKEVLTKEAKVIRVPLAPTVAGDAEGGEETLDQRGLIKEAFAGDDVVSDFLKDKRRQEDAGKPKHVDLTLPGWGEWGGTGLKPSRRKRKRFRIRAAPAPPRKDERLPAVIISEKRNSSLTLHQVNSLPFPFQTHTQFESTVRAPVGRTWNTERTVKTMTKPRVVTQLGAIIPPMDREQLMKQEQSKAGAGTAKPQRHTKA